MEKQNYFTLFCVFAASINIYAEARGSSHGHGHGSERRLFVFGDSYADTGNWPKSSSSSWKEPYGTTFPGQPSGRFSDGRILTDYIASFVGIKSPPPPYRSHSRAKSLKYGMNFAHGGTGVFNTLVDQPNMTTQIEFFKKEVKFYTEHDLTSSIALVSVAGNDYATYIAQNGTPEYFPDFTKSLINRLSINLRQIHDLGVRKIGVTTMEPLGCLPRFTALVSYQNCSQTENSLAVFHNQMLEQSLKKLNNETGGSVFVVLDLYGAFVSALNIQDNHPVRGSSKFGNGLKPCCMGTAGGFCGSIENITGKKKYTLCDNPKESFFWDIIHPSQQGWSAVYSALKPSLHQIL